MVGRRALSRGPAGAARAAGAGLREDRQPEPRHAGHGAERARDGRRVVQPGLNLLETIEGQPRGRRQRAMQSCVEAVLSPAAKLLFRRR